MKVKETILLLPLSNVKKLTEIIRLLDNELNWKMLSLIAQKEANVTELIVATKKDQSAVSFYLGKLRKAGIVETRRDGKNVYYSINEKVFTHYINGLVWILSYAFLLKIKLSTEETLIEEAKKIANELVEKMGIVTSSGWKNADCATQCALIAVERILELLPEFSLDYQIQSEHKLYKFVEKELKIKLENERLF